MRSVIHSLSAKLRDFLHQNAQRAARDKAHNSPRLLVVFQGRQGYRAGMGRDLFSHEPVFRDTVKRCSDTIQERTGFQLIDAFESKEAASLVHQSEFHSILAHAVIHLGLSELWLSRGLTPHATIGLSMGEITSPYMNLALSLEEVMLVALSAAQWDERLLNRGKLIILQAGLKIAEELCRQCSVPLECFAEYGPSTTLVFCAGEDVGTVSALLKSHGLRYNIYGGDYAYHTTRFVACKDIVSNELSKLQPKGPRYEFYSSLAGALIPASVHFDANYWYWMLAQPVLFNTAFEKALSDGYNTMLNIGPHPYLSAYLKEAAQKLDKPIVILDSMRDDEPEHVTFNKTCDALKHMGLIKSAARHARSGSSSVTMPEISVSPELFNTLAPEVVQNPYPFYEGLRKKGSAHFLARHGYWLILDYDDVASALKQPKIFSSKPARGLDPFLVGADPPTHTPVRKAVQPFFSPAELTRLNSYIEDCARQLLSAARRKNEFDIVGDFADKLTQSVIGHCLGLTELQLDSLRQKIGPNKQPPQYYTVLGNFFREYVGASQTTDQHNFCNRLMQGRNDYASKEEVASLMKLMWVAGTSTTSMLISTAVSILLHHRSVLAEIRNDRTLLPLFIEEVLRFDPPEQTAWRVTTQEVEIGSVRLPADAPVRLSLAAANRDPKHFRDADLFILSRDPKDHFAFGAGPHYCLGAHLARMEAHIALSALLEQCPSLLPVKPVNMLRYVQSEYFRSLQEYLVKIC